MHILFFLNEGDSVQQIVEILFDLPNLSFSLRSRSLFLSLIDLEV